MKGFAMNEGEKNAPWLDTPDPQRFIKNAAKFNDLMMMYRCAIREVQTKLEVLDDEFSVEYKRNPISFIKTRIKKPESIYRKLQKLGYDFTAENIQEQLNDVAGVRVVCAFIDDIYTVANLIAGQDDIKVIKIKDYIKNPKPNGYRSYHMIVEIPVFFSKGENTYESRTSDPHQRHGLLGYIGASAPLQEGNRGLARICRDQ